MNELNKHLHQVQNIADRVRDFTLTEASDPKQFSQTIVEDLGVLADAVLELIRRIDN